MSGPERVARNLRAEQFYGMGIDRLMPPGGVGYTMVPWPSASRLKHYEDYDNSLVQEALRRPPQLREIDPVDLHSTQNSIIRHHVEHYLSGEYEKTGQTSQHDYSVGNRFPVIYRREPSPINPSSESQNMILAGHHRAAAALVQGRPLRAIYLEGPWGPPR